MLGVIGTINGWGFSAVHDGCLGQDYRPLVDSLLLASSSSTYNSQVQDQVVKANWFMP